MSQLAESFPGLRRKTGVRPWDPELLDDWASSVASTTETQLAAFVLEVWNMHHPWKCGPFRFVKAMAYFDEGNRRPILAWAEKPWTA